MKRVTTKAYEESLKLLRIIAAIKEESQIETLHRLIVAEYEQVIKELPCESGTRLQDGTGPNA